jgi:hypothetical protein
MSRAMGAPHRCERCRRVDSVWTCRIDGDNAIAVRAWLAASDSNPKAVAVELCPTCLDDVKRLVLEIRGPRSA